MKLIVKIYFLVVLICLFVCVLNGGVNISVAQDIIYTPDDSKVKTAEFSEIKEKLNEAFNKNLHKYVLVYLIVSEKKCEFVYQYEDSLEIWKIKYSNFRNINVIETEYELYNVILDENYVYFFWKGKNLSYAKKFADALYALKNKKYTKKETDELIQFEETAKLYRDSETKPDLSEDARKYYIQATALTKDKNYYEAIKLYQKVIETDQTYPPAHFNISLLLGEIEDYEYAILEMKKYLLLVPDATNARAAQDKIYEWEVKIEK